MLNYIWAGLIIISILFALGHDIQDELDNPYSNGITRIVSYSLKKNETKWLLELPEQNLDVIIDSDAIPDTLTFQANESLPDHWQAIARHQPDKSTLSIDVIDVDPVNQQLQVLLPEVHWLKLRAIMDSAFDMARFAVQLAIGLAGIMALWLGLMKIAEQSGLIHILIKAIHPLLHWLFPDIPKNHPALGSIGLNLSANILGLGNAATPLGIKAMQQLQSLNQNKEQASDAMCMFLALNTSSVQLLPPVTLIALMGTQISELMPAIIFATGCSTLVAIVLAKYYARKSKR